jgi:hypothetical protein
MVLYTRGERFEDGPAACFRRPRRHLKDTARRTVLFSPGVAKTFGRTEGFAIRASACAADARTICAS